MKEVNFNKESCLAVVKHFDNYMILVLGITCPENDVVDQKLFESLLKRKYDGSNEFNEGNITYEEWLKIDSECLYEYITIMESQQ